MWIISRPEEIPRRGGCAALGFFDGLHRGHAAVIGRAVAAGGPAFLLTLTDVPRHTGAGRLLTPAMERRVLSAWGVQGVLALPFADWHGLSPQDFVRQVLVETLGVRQAVCGFNYRFGRGAAGDAALLAALCGEAGIDAQILPAVTVDGQPVSSTRVRQALAEGDVALAARLLGRPFGFDFAVAQGDHRGRTLDFPTLNQPFPDDFIRPRYGVYAASAYVQGVWRPAVCNVGVRPTVGGGSLRAETHILHYAGDLYGRQVPVCLHAFLREEQRFDSLETLRRAIRRDADSARRYFEIHAADADGAAAILTDEGHDL